MTFKLDRAGRCLFVKVSVKISHRVWYRVTEKMLSLRKVIMKLINMNRGLLTDVTDVITTSE